MEFFTQTGYMPVTKAAFENELPKAIEGMDNAKYASLYQAYMDTQAEYTFYVPPQMENYLTLETAFEDSTRSQLSLGRREYLENGGTDLEQISEKRFREFKKNVER